MNLQSVVDVSLTFVVKVIEQVKQVRKLEFKKPHYEVHFEITDNWPCLFDDVDNHVLVEAIASR